MTLTLVARDLTMLVSILLVIMKRISASQDVAALHKRQKRKALRSVCARNSDRQRQNAISIALLGHASARLKPMLLMHKQVGQRSTKCVWVLLIGNLRACKMAGKPTRSLVSAVLVFRSVCLWRHFLLQRHEALLL